ncbi:MAG: hypothetical protein BGO49_00505 [Planctomycetales bacterium 71-10]|nr:MAG: hypothetical protein BGO49_00505 [Planctomycetales bacterium 71-10]
MEILVKGPLHEDFRSLLGRFVEEVAGEIGVAFLGLGETTWKRPDVGRGLEADQCFYFDPAKVAAARAAPGPPPAPAERPAVRLSGRWSVHRVANLGEMGKNRALARGSSGEAPGERHHGDSRATRPV